MAQGEAPLSISFCLGAVAATVPGISSRGGATGSKGHELILLQGAISCQAVVLSGARRDF